LEDIMSFPDRIERTVELRQDPQRVWAALTTADGLAAWFGDKADIDLRVGGVAHLTWEKEGFSATLDIKVIDPPHRFAYTWGIMGLPDDDPRRTYVEFVLEPTATGTRLTVTESGFAQVPADVYESAYRGNTDGWRSELGELVAYLDGLAA
jgi:uncharacterized protein YndB with AHSA1/START domain